MSGELEVCISIAISNLHESTQAPMASSSSTKDKEEVKATMEEEVRLPSPTPATEELHRCEVPKPKKQVENREDSMRRACIKRAHR